MSPLNCMTGSLSLWRSNFAILSGVPKVLMDLVSHVTLPPLLECKLLGGLHMTFQSSGRFANLIAIGDFTWEHGLSSFSFSSSYKILRRIDKVFS